MSYEKTIWTDGATALSAEHMNNIEDGIEALDTGKVDKVAGKGLSANDYTTAEKTKLAGIAAGAEVNQNAFAIVDIESGSATSLKAASKRDTVTFIAGSNVTMTASPGNNIVTINARDTTYSNATTSAAGLMSAADKTKLNNIRIRIATAATQSAVTIGTRQVGEVSFKYKTAADRFSAEAIVVPMKLPDFVSGLAISSYSHTEGYFVLNMTNPYSDTTRTVPSGKEVKLLVIDNEVS